MFDPTANRHAETRRAHQAERVAEIEARTAPAARFVEAIRREDVARHDAARSAAMKDRHNLHGWSRSHAFTPMTEDEIMAAAAKRQADHETFEASPAGRIHIGVRALAKAGCPEVAERVLIHVSAGYDLEAKTVSASRCGCILKVLDGMNTAPARAIVQAVADNLRAL